MFKEQPHVGNYEPENTVALDFLEYVMRTEKQIKELSLSINSKLSLYIKKGEPLYIDNYVELPRTAMSNYFNGLYDSIESIKQCVDSIKLHIDESDL